MPSVRPPLLAWLLLALALPLAAARGPWTKANTACHMAAAAGNRARLRSFLWRRPGGLPPVLIHGAWDARGRLLECAWRAEPAVLAWYRDSCERGAGGGPLERAFWGPELQRDLDALAERRDSCRGAERLGQAWGGRAERAEPGAGRGRRVRRGWTVPGTLWCGAGNSAGNVSELGVFQGPDVCCREHDQCENQIDALGYKYGMRNYRFHTISHCDCDARFRECLMTLNDTISNFIGVSFFNLLEIPCFVLEENEDCVDWNWWGGCKRYGSIPLARLVEQSLYGPNLPFSEKSDHVTSPPPPLHPGRHRGKGQKHPRKNRRKHPDRGAAKRQRMDPEHDKRHDLVTPQVPISWLNRTMTPAPKIPRTTPMLLLPTVGATAEAGLLQTGATPYTQQSHPKEARPPGEMLQTEKPLLVTSGHRYTTEPSSSAPSQSCNCYRRLDQCPYRIAPNEVKYQLHNVDSRTLFHCNCTRRLARFLRKMKGPNEVEEEVLSDFVSSSCFLLQAPPGCMEGEEEHPNCIDVGRAILAPARHLTNRLTRKQPGASSKEKRQERTLLGSPVKLYEKCMQLAQASHPTMPR